MWTIGKKIILMFLLIGCGQQRHSKVVVAEEEQRKIIADDIFELSKNHSAEMLYEKSPVLPLRKDGLHPSNKLILPPEISPIKLLYNDCAVLDIPRKEDSVNVELRVYKP